MEKPSKRKGLIFILSAPVPQIIYCVVVYCYSQYFYAFVNQSASNFPLISGAVLVPVCALPFLPYCPASTAYSRSMKLEKRELQFDGYRLSLSYLFWLPIIGLLIYWGFAFFQCHLSEKTVGILFDNIVFYFLIGIGVCILLLFKTAYHALKFSIHHKANRKNGL